MNGFRRIRPAAFFAAALFAPLATSAAPNFRVVNLPPEQAARYERAAESAYLRLSQWWFGQSHPELWRPTAGPNSSIPPVSMTVHLQSGRTGGRTSFRIERGQVFNWRMTVAGSTQRILEDVIPHEVGHVVFYSRFRRPLGRCLDEGTATLGESPREHAAVRKIVADALRKNTALPFARILDDPRYPARPGETALFYAQSHSLVEFLLQRIGREKFIAFLDDSRQPTKKLREHLGCDITRLQTDWEAWFRATAAGGLGCREFGCAMHGRAKPQATNAGTRDTKPVVYAFTAGWCAACRPFKRDIKAGRFEGYRIVLVDPDRDSQQWKAVTAKMAAETGHRGPVPLPSWWVPGSKRLVVMRDGYSAPGLLQILGGLIRGLARILYNPELEPDGTRPSQTAPAGSGATSSDPANPAAKAEDWSGVTIVLLAAEQPTGALQGKARRALIGLSRGPLERKVREVTAGNAALRIVAERNEPIRYRSLLSAAGLEPSWFDVIVLVPRRSTGLVRGLVVKRIEAVAEGRLRSKPHIEVLFERTHPADFAAVHAALQSFDEPQPPTSPLSDAAAAIRTLTKADLKLELGTFGREFVRKELEAAIVGTISGGPPPDPVRDLKQEIMFWLASIGLPLWLVERITKNRRLSQEVTKAWQRLRSSSPPSPPSAGPGESPGTSSAASPGSGSASG